MGARLIIDRLALNEMSMEINSLRDQNTSFDCSNWTWRPLMHLCWQVANLEQLELDTDWDLWGTNDGAGLKTQEECNQLADAIEKYHGRLKGKSGDVRMPDGFIQKIEAMYGEISPGLMQRMMANYVADDETVREWVQFLRTCGGFEIW